MFLVCFALAVPFLTAVLPLPIGVVAAAVGAAGATLADGVKPVVAGYVIDDNLTIPPAAAVGFALVFVVAGPGLDAALWV
jgi:dolichol kinase